MFAAPFFLPVTHHCKPYSFPFSIRASVGLSNKLDRELKRREPSKRTHGEVVGAAIVGSKLFCEVVRRVKAVAGVKAFLVLPVAVSYFAVVAWRVGADELVSDFQCDSSGLKQGRQIVFAVGESVGKLEAVICLDTFDPDPPACIPLEQLFQEVSGGICRLFGISGKEAQASELVNSGVLKQAELRIRDTPAGNHFHIYLNALAGIGHLLIRLGRVCFLLPGHRKQTKFAHDPEQALRAAGIAAPAQPMPQLHHTEVWIAAAHVTNQFYFFLCVLIGMAVRTSGLAGQRISASIPARLPEVDVRPAFAVFPACTAYPVFLCIFH